MSASRRLQPLTVIARRGHRHIGPSEDAARVQAAYSPSNYRRLQQIKRDHDPANVFRSVQNIPPAADAV